MEIVSIVLSGVLRHEDNLGNVAETTFGGIQRMSAGTGAIHTEHNPSDSEPVRLLQLWFMPRTRGTAPSYATGRFDPAKLDGRLLPVVAAEPAEEIVGIAQDMTIYLGRVQAGETLEFRQEPGRRVFAYLIEGQVTLNGEPVLRPGDSARVEAAPELNLTAGGNALVMLIDLP
jgi:redox-sensitive bicupin YhaK (pirin superfamily)